MMMKINNFTARLKRIQDSETMMTTTPTRCESALLLSCSTLATLSHSVLWLFHLQRLGLTTRLASISTYDRLYLRVLSATSCNNGVTLASAIMMASSVRTVLDP